MTFINEQNKFQNWMCAVRTAARRHCVGDGLYAGADGAKRLARECGPAILDFGEYGKKNMGATYGAICVIAYDLKPPIDAKTWLQELRKGFEYAKEIDKRRNV